MPRRLATLIDKIRRCAPSIAFERGLKIGYFSGYRQGRAVARPVVVPDCSHCDAERSAS